MFLDYSVIGLRYALTYVRFVSERKAVLTSSE